MFETAVIAIGGKGTRLREITKDIPKPLFPIQGKSTLLRTCEELVQNNIKKIILTINYEINQFEEEINKIKKIYNIDIKTYKEKEPLGECGALWKLKDLLSNEILFVNGDIIFSIDILRLYKFHQEISSDITIVTHTSTHPFDSDLLSAPNGSLIKQIYPKNLKRDKYLSGYLGNTGIACINKNILNSLGAPESIKNSSIFNHIVVKALSKKIRIFSYNTSEYIKDMGTPDRFNKVNKDIKSGLVNIKNFKNKQKALFLDRDNTLIKCQKNQYILSVKDVEIIKENILKISKIACNFNLNIIATNQPQISMGKLSFKQLDEINSYIIKYCIKLNLLIDDVIFCPHHPHGGYLGEIATLKVNCFCRKPNPGMFFDMAQKKNIDLHNSLFIGDSYNDEKAAERAKIPFLNIKDL